MLKSGQIWSKQFNRCQNRSKLDWMVPIGGKHVKKGPKVSKVFTTKVWTIKKKKVKTGPIWSKLSKTGENGWKFIKMSHNGSNKMKAGDNMWKLVKTGKTGKIACTQHATQILIQWKCIFDELFLLNSDLLYFVLPPLCVERNFLW